MIMIEKCECRSVSTEIENDAWIDSTKYCVRCRRTVAIDVIGDLPYPEYPEEIEK